MKHEMKLGLLKSQSYSINFNHLITFPCRSNSFVTVFNIVNNAINRKQLNVLAEKIDLFDLSQMLLLLMHCYVLIEFLQSGVVQV